MIFREWLYIKEDEDDARSACQLFTCFCFLLRLIYSALHRYMQLARYAGQLEAEKYVIYFWPYFAISRVLSLRILN